MLQLFMLWNILNTPVPESNPLHTLPILRPPQLVRKRKPFYSPVTVRIMVILGLIGCGVLFYLGFFFFFLLLLVFMVLGFLLVASGGYLTVKIVQKLGEIRSAGMYDLISITPDGNHSVSWLMGRIIYKQIKWLKNVRFMGSVVGYLIFGFAILNVIMLLDSGSNSVYDISMIEYSLISISNVVIVLAGLYSYYIYGMVMGYLLAIWGDNLSTDIWSRLIACVGGFIASHLVTYFLLYLIHRIGLSNFYLFRNWIEGIILGIIQFTCFIVIIEIQVRVMMRLLAHQADLPYAVWRSELGL